MKKWKKTHRQRRKKKYSIDLFFKDSNEYNKVNNYRISKSYSWSKFASEAIKTLKYSQLT